jgi:beta-galactosidase
VRQPAHPVCQGLSDDLLRDWRGSSSLLPAYPLTAEFHRTYPQELWCGFLNSRTWQWGNYGAVASVVIEKPARGNWSTILDCEFDQQYTPLTEWITPRGRVIFSQLDFSGRDLPDPAAQRLLGNLLTYAHQPAEASLQPCRVEARADFAAMLKDLGLRSGGSDIAIIGPGASIESAKAAVAAAQTVVCLGLDGKALSAILPFPVTTEERPLTHTLIGRPTTGALVGLGNSEFHWRARMGVPAIAKAPAELKLAPGGILAEGTVGARHIVLMQSTPALFDWQDAPQLKRTWRHSLVALARALTNCGVALDCPLPERLNAPAAVSLDLAGRWRFTTDLEKKLQAAQVAAPGFDASGWRELETPGPWEGKAADLKDYDGIAWYRREFDLTTVPSAAVALKVGAVDDEDWTYLNGQLVGHIGTDNHPEEYWSAERVYAVPSGLLHVGRNVIAVRVSDLRGGGGIVRGPLGLFEPGRWLDSYYLDEPTALDDPYRYNRW